MRGREREGERNILKSIPLCLTLYDWVWFPCLYNLGIIDFSSTTLNYALLNDKILKENLHVTQFIHQMAFFRLNIFYIGRILHMEMVGRKIWINAGYNKVLRELRILLHLNFQIFWHLMRLDVDLNKSHSVFVLNTVTAVFVSLHRKFYLFIQFLL